MREVNLRKMKKRAGGRSVMLFYLYNHSRIVVTSVAIANLVLVG